MKIIRKITEEENKYISKLIGSVVAEESYDKKTEAIYISCHKVNGVDYIYINVIRKDFSNENDILWFSSNNSLILKKQYISRTNFHLGVDPSFIIDLANGIIVLDTLSNEYTNIKKRALNFDFSCYNNKYDEVELEPPLKLVKRIK